MKVKAYIKKSYNELVNKVTWPSWADLQSSAIIVMIASFIIAMIVYVMDVSFSALMTFIYELAA